MPDRYTEVVQILRRVLYLNLAVAVAKIGLGYYTVAYHAYTFHLRNAAAYGLHQVAAEYYRIAGRYR